MGSSVQAFLLNGAIEAFDVRLVVFLPYSRMAMLHLLLMQSVRESN